MTKVEGEGKKEVAIGFSSRADMTFFFIKKISHLGFFFCGFRLFDGFECCILDFLLSLITGAFLNFWCKITGVSW